MHKLSSTPAIVSKFELLLDSGNARKIHYLTVVEDTNNKIEFYLTDYYGWFVTDAELIEQAKNEFKKYREKFWSQSLISPENP